MTANVGATETHGKPLDYGSFSSWKAISKLSLSPNGEFVVYSSTGADGSKSVTVSELHGLRREMTLDGPATFEFTRNSGFVIAPDSARQKPGIQVLRLVNLAAFTERRIEGVRQFQILPTQSQIILRSVSSDAPDTISDLAIESLDSGERRPLGRIIGPFAIDGASTAIGYVTEIDAAHQANVLDLKTSRVSSAPYLIDTQGTVNLSLTAFAKRLVIASAVKGSSGTTGQSLSWFDVQGERDSMVGSTLPIALDGLTLDTSRKPRSDSAGHAVVVSMRPGPLAAIKSRHVDIWRTSDDELQSVQDLAIRAFGQRAREVIANLDKREIALVSEDTRAAVTYSDDFSRALIQRQRPPNPRSPWTESFDAYTLDTVSGTKIKMQIAASRALLSPDGTHIIWWNGNSKRWMMEPSIGPATTPLVRNNRADFKNEDWDRPGLVPSYGGSGWTPDGRSVFLYDKFDVWLVNLENGGEKNWTSGVGRLKQIQLRLDPDDPYPVSEDKPTLLLGSNTVTGVESIWLRSSAGRLTKVLEADKHLSKAVRSEDGSVIAYVAERFDESPNVWISDGGEPSRRVSNINPQMDLYRWGRSTRLTYVDRKNRKASGQIFVPEGPPGRSGLPLLTIVYERRDDPIQLFRAPAAALEPCIPCYVSRGYAVLLPDIIYDVGSAGASAMDNVMRAISSAKKVAPIDATRLGIAGQSWGGFEVAYIISHSHLFAAAEAAAPVVDSVSAYDAIHYESGESRQGTYEGGQSRIGATPWEMPSAYLEASPVLRANFVRTPFLADHNSRDSVVPWSQAMEWFLALRRLGKEAYLIDFNDEGHNLRDPANVRYWTVHLDEFFDHFLLGASTPAWMLNGVPYGERGRREIDKLFTSP